MENLITSKYKIAKDIQMQPGRYDYVMELLLCKIQIKSAHPILLGK